jgi:hypothetical protein
MQSLLLKYKLTVKVLAIFIQQVNDEKFIKRLLLGFDQDLFAQKKSCKNWCSTF